MNYKEAMGPDLVAFTFVKLNTNEINGKWNDVFIVKYH